MNRHGSPPRWNKVRVVFECALIIAPFNVSRRSMTLMVYGDTEFAVLHALRMQFPRHCDFTILDPQLENGWGCKSDD